MNEHDNFQFAEPLTAVKTELVKVIISCCTRHKGSEVKVMCTRQELQTVTENVVSSVLNIVSDKIYKIILYGSYARGDFTQESDVDIMVILDCSKEEVLSYRKQISKMASRIGLEHDLMLSVLLRDKESYLSGQEFLPFYRNVDREGVSLYG